MKPWWQGEDLTGPIGVGRKRGHDLALANRGFLEDYWFCLQCGLYASFEEVDSDRIEFCPGNQQPFVDVTAGDGPFEWCRSTRQDGCFVFATHPQRMAFFGELRSRYLNGELPAVRGVSNTGIQFYNGSSIALLLDEDQDHPQFRGRQLAWIIGPMVDFNSYMNAGGQGKGKGSTSIPPGYVRLPKGRGTYHAKEHLKRLGGYWWPGASKNEACWLVPEERAVEARRLVAEAEAGRLSPDLPPPGRDVRDAVVCWECGERRYLREVVTRGGNAEQFYCGCAEAVADNRARRAVRR